MPAAMEVLSWGRIDPYYVWSEVTRWGVDMAPDDAWLPVLVEATSAGAAVELRRGVEAEFGDRSVCPLSDDEAAGFVLHVRRDATAAVLQFLSSKLARWEISLPIIPRAATGSAPATSRQPADGQVVGFIDYGCAFGHSKFRAWKDGKRTLGSAVLALWDQAGTAANAEAAAAGFRPPAWQAPPDFGYGMEWQRVSPGGLGIDAYIQQFARGGEMDEELCYRNSGYRGLQRHDPHGTFVMDLAVGHPSPLPGADSGEPPPKRDIVFVELPRLKTRGRDVTWLLQAQVLAGVQYVFSCVRPDQPVTVNLSYGSYAGPHDGTTILERALDGLIERRRAKGGPTDLVIAAGNAGDSRTHAEALLLRGGQSSFTLFAPPATPTDQFVEIWFDGPGDGCQVRVVPAGQRIEGTPWVGSGEVSLIEDGSAKVAMLIAPKQVGQALERRMALLAIAPTAPDSGAGGAPSGAWRIDVRNQGSQECRVRAWVERNDPPDGSGDARQAFFQGPTVTPYDTLNRLAHGQQGLVVGACVAGTDEPSRECSRGIRNESAGQLFPPRNAGNGRPGPEWLALSDDGQDPPGLAGAALLGNEQVRHAGTSVAAAVATRYVVRRRAAGETGSSVTAPLPGGAGEWALPRVSA